MVSQFQLITDIGNRLRSYRLGAGLTPEEVAAKTGISRAAIYRYESGQPIRVDALGKIADLLEISLASLFGVGSENISSAITFFERLRQIEAESTQITALFGPVPYLLTTEAYDDLLPDVLAESVPETAVNRDDLDASIESLLDILKSRKQAYRKLRPNLTALVSTSEIAHFLQTGLVGDLNSPPGEIGKRKDAAKREVEHIIHLCAEQPMGTQIGLVQDSMPSTTFQILRSGTSARVATSPFRLGAPANIRIGVATIMAAEESVRMHQDVAESIWKNSVKGDAACKILKQMLAQI